SIRIPRPDRTVSIGVPNACNDCHREETARWAAERVEEWYGPVTDTVGFQRFAEEFHADDVDAAGAAEGLVRIARDTAQLDLVRASALARLADRPGRDALDAAT